MLLYSFALLALLSPAPEVLIHSVEVRGATRPVTVETRKGEPLTEEKLTRDVRALYATGRYSDVQVERAETAEGVNVIFRLTEKPPIKLRKLEFDPNGESRPLKLDEGTPVDERSAAALGAKLRQTLIDEGHADAQVTTTLVPVGPDKADLRVKLDPGPREVVRDVRFSGDLGISENELRGALRATRPHTVIPKIWKQQAPLSDNAVQADVSRVRSLYISRGYLDAEVRLDDIQHSPDGKATITIDVKAGPRFGIRQSELVDNDKNTQTPLGLKGAFSGRDLCMCLFAARRTSEKEGRLDFKVRLNAEDVDPPSDMILTDTLEKWVDLRASVDAGPQYRVGRIEFRGNHAFDDSTVRRAFRLNEGDLLDSDALRRSVGRVNKMGLFQTINGDQVYVIRDAETGTADIRVALKEIPKGRWFLSGPIGPMKVAGPLQAAISSRLPSWGSGLFEASTYVLTFSLSAWANPLSSFLPFGAGKSGFLVPLLLFERPYLEGQSWLSGFAISPQLSWQTMLTGYGMSQAHHRLRNLLIPDAVQPDLLAALERQRPGQKDAMAAGTLLCEPPKSRWNWLRVAGGVAVDLTLGARPF